MSAFEVAEVLAQVPHRTWEGDKGTLHYFKVKLTDGTVAEAGKKKPDTPPQVGDRYKTLRPLPDNAPSEAVPMLQGPITDYQGGGSKDFKADPAKLRSENARSALHAAKDLVVAGKVPLEDMGAKTAQFYSYITKHSEGE
jgi:hypothetical protein